MTVADRKPSDPVEASAEAAGGPSRLEEVGQRIEAAFTEARVLAAQLQNLAEIEIDRARLKVGSWGLRAALIAGAVVAGLAMLPLAVWYLLSGLVGAISVAAGGREWVGRLAVGGLVLAAFVVAVALAKLRRDRAELARLERKYGPLEPKGP